VDSLPDLDTRGKSARALDKLIVQLVSHGRGKIARLNMEGSAYVYIRKLIKRTGAPMQVVQRNGMYFAVIDP
jgi:hypothetical protein